MNTSARPPHALAHGALGCPSADEQAQQDVCAALSRTPGLDATQLGVSLNEAGDVELIGAVPSKRQRDLALRVARRVAGSRCVHSHLELSSPGPSPRESVRSR
ncbi:MAG: BON domain-containing protein [Polyangiaceae bacterium]